MEVYEITHVLYDIRKQSVPLDSLSWSTELNLYETRKLAQDALMLSPAFKGYAKASWSDFTEIGGVLSSHRYCVFTRGALSITFRIRRITVVTTLPWSPHNKEEK